MSTRIGHGTHTAQVPTGIWVGTRSIQAQDGATFEVVDPATEQVIVSVADSGPAEWGAALEAAETARPVWERTAPRVRGEVLRALFEEVTARREEFATVMTVEMGKPYAEALGEVAYGAEYVRWFAEEAVRQAGRFSPAPAGNGHILVTRKPVGTVVAITPWNFPLAMATRKIAPALAAGCPILVKPAHETPLTMLLLGEVIAEVFERFDVPQGLVSILPTTKSAEFSSTLQADPRVKKITFTGSTAVGKILVRQSADHLQRMSMELGGNAPFVIAEDADMDLVLTCALQAKMRNGGEACIAANRFLVHESRVEEFTQRLTAAMEQFTMGHGLDEGTTLGPIITPKQRDGIAGLVEDAVGRGARVTTGGSVPDRPGYFYPATVVVDIPEDAKILHQEIFGPVATISTFSTNEEAVELANATEFGLATYAFTENVHTAQFFVENLEAGMIGVNRGAISDPAAPFGGIKQSGFGREGGCEGIEEYQHVVYVAWT